MKTLIILSLGSGYGGAERSIEIILKHIPDDLKVLIYAQNSMHIERLLCLGALPKQAELRRAQKTNTAWSKRILSLRLLYDCLKNPNAKILINTNASALLAAMTANFLPEFGKRSFLYVRDFLWTDFDYIFKRLINAKVLLPSSVVAERLGYLSPYYLKPYGPIPFTVIPDMVSLPKPTTQPPKNHSQPYLATNITESNDGFFLHLATVNPWKGHADLVVATCLLKGQNQTLRVCSYGHVGNHRLNTHLQSLITKLDLGNLYQIQGHEPDPGHLIQACQALVVTSRSHSGGPETFGRTVIEAWSYGKPVIAYNCGAVADIIEHGVDGLLVAEGDTQALANAITHLANAPDIRHRMGQAGLEKVKRQYEASLVTMTLLETIF